MAEMALTRKELQKNFYNRRKAQKLCVKCGKPLDREGVTCSGCNEKHNQIVKQDRKFFKEMGLCPRCGKHKLIGNETICPECSAYEYATTMKSREKLGKEHYNEVHRTWSKKEHQRRLDDGICTRCGKRKADYGYKTCGICRERNTNKKREREGKKPDRRERYKQGLCFFCDNPVKPGYKVCEYHYQKNVENSRSQKAVKARQDLQKQGILY